MRRAAAGPTHSNSGGVPGEEFDMRLRSRALHHRANADRAGMFGEPLEGRTFLSGSFVGLGTTGGDAVLVPSAVSGNGTVVGTIYGSPAVDPPASSEGFRWTAATGTATLGPGQASDVTDDGSVVVGYTDIGPYRWTETDGFQALDLLPGVSPNDLRGGGANGVSGDGSIIVGASSSTLGLQAVRWTGTSALGLGYLPGGLFDSTATAVS